MTPGRPEQLLERLSRASSAKWLALGRATESWARTLRLGFLLLVVEIPILIGAAIWVIHT